EAQARKMHKSLSTGAICPQVVRRVNRLAPRRTAEYAALLFGCHSPRGHCDQVSGTRQNLANAQISWCNSRRNRIQAVRLCVSRAGNLAATGEPVCGVARGKRGRVFFVSNLDLETGDGDAQGSVKWFNPTKG